MGLRRRQDRFRPDPDPAAHPTGIRSALASTTQRSATSSTRPDCAGASTPARTAIPTQRVLVELSGRETYPLRSRLGEERRLRRRGSFSPTSNAAISRTSPGSRRPARIPIIADCGGGLGPVVGGLGRQRDRREQVLGFDRRSSCSGTTGAASTTTFRRPMSTTTASAFASR